MEPSTRSLLAQQLSDQALHGLAQRQLGAQSAEHRPRKLAAYFSSPDEPDTTVLLHRLSKLGYELYLPVCEPEYQLSWTHWKPGMPLVPSTLAPVTEPVGTRHGAELFDEIELMFIPALAVDQAGMRLGQGGGYYDRFLPKLDGRGTRLAALVYDDEFLEAGSFTVAQHDRPVGLVITPRRLVELENGF